MADKATLRLNVPAKKLESLTFCPANADALEAWVADLPMANPADASRRLYQAITEMNQCQMQPRLRFTLIEILRHPINEMCSTLGKSLLNQPVVLPTRERKIAAMVQALQNCLAVGYKVVVADAIRARTPLADTADPTTIVVLRSVHRALNDLTRSLLRSCQLYTEPPTRIWHEINQLFWLAERTRHGHLTLGEIGVDGLTIEHMFARALLLGTARPNKLRQRELAYLFDALTDWARLCKITDPAAVLTTDTAPAPFLLNLAADTPPVYSDLYEGPPGALTRGFATQAVIVELEKIVAEHETEDTELPRGITPQLIDHLRVAWSTPTKRSFSRSAADGSLNTCVGMTAVHFYVAKERPFDLLLTGGIRALQNKAANPFLKEPALQRREENIGKDVWSNAFDIRSSKMSELHDIEVPENILKAISKQAEKVPESVPDAFQVAIEDTSPGGYCTLWNNGAPANLQAGELMALRDTSGDSTEDSSGEEWSVAVVRWVRQTDGETRVPLTGLELLGPRAVPVGARVIQTRGGPTEYQRGLVMPAVPAIRQPASLILPKMPFVTGNKIHINYDGREGRAVIEQLIGSTASFNQFEFRFLDQDIINAELDDDF